MQAEGGSQGEPALADTAPGAVALAAPVGSSALRVQRRLLRTLTLLAVALLVGLVAWFSWHERRQVIDAATAQSARQVAGLAEELSHALRLARVATEQVDARLQRLPQGATQSQLWGEATGERSPLLAALALPFGLHALDREGRALGVAPGSGGQAHDGAAATRHVHGSGAAPAAAPSAEAAATHWQVGTTHGAPGARVIPLRRQAAPNPHGVVAYAVDLSHSAVLSRFERERLQPGGGMALFRIELDASLTLLARSPMREGELGQQVRGPLAEALVRSPVGTFSALTQVDQVHRLVAYQRLDGDAADLVLGLGTPTDALLAGWRRSLPWTAAITLLLASGMLWGGWRLDRSMGALAANQQALEQSETNFRALAGNLPDVVARMDRHGRHLYVNAAVYRATGLAPEAFIGKTNAEMGMPRENVAVWMSTLARVFDSGQAERLEFAYPGPQGLRRWESIVTLEPAVARAERTALVISRDITERLQTEAAREALNRRLADVLESMSDGFVSLDRDWRYVTLNAKAGELLGREPASLIGKHIWTEFPEGVGQPFHRAYERAMNEGVTVVLEEHYAPRGRWFENRIYPSADGIAIFFTDITERRLAADALRNSEERLRLALQAASQGLYDLDLRTGEAVVSPEYALMLGYDPAQFHETNAAWRERLHPDDREAVQQVYEDYVAGRRPDYRVEFRQRLRDGGWKWILSVGRIQERDADGTPLRMLGTHTNLDAIKAAQAAQMAATQRFEKLFQAAPEAISVSELDSGRFLQVNDAFCEVFGHGREHIVGRTSIELGLWTDARGRDAIVERLRGGGAVQGFEGVASRGDGAPIDVLFSAERIDFDGRDALLLMFRDISQRKRLEKALQASEARLAHLLARAPTVIYTARAEGDFAATYYSPNLPALLGWAPQRFLGEPTFWLDHVHPDDRAGVLRDLEALATRDDLVLEYRFQHADGRWLWMRDQVSVQRDAQAAPVELVGAWVDITARREAEDEVRRLAAELELRVQERTAQLALSEARYRTIFETVPVAISEEDWSVVQGWLRKLRAAGVVDGAAYFAQHPEFVQRCLQAVRMVRLNRKALAMHDASDQAAALPDLQSFYPSAEDLPQFVGELEAMWSGRRLYTAKKSLPALSGRPLSLMVSVSLPALDDADGTALACLVDITEIDRLNAELDKSLARLRQANKELETFTYSVSHDLKAPLRGIDGYSRLLLTDHQDQLDEEGRQFLSYIRRATQHMGVLIDDLLSYSRLERRELTLAPQALAELVEGVLAPYRNDPAAQGVELRVDLPQGLRVIGDAQGLAIALRNLVDNAIKFSRERQPARIEITAARSGKLVRLAVRDNGLGFDMKFHNRIFAIFQRLHRAEDYPGTGVGLAIVRKAMERMGGRVWAESAPGQGATFTIELPEAA